MPVLLEWSMHCHNSLTADDWPGHKRWVCISPHQRLSSTSLSPLPQLRTRPHQPCITMSYPSKKRLDLPYSRNLDDIIDQYSTPAPSSSPHIKSLLSDNSPQSARSIPSSPPSYSAKQCHHRDTSTNSGYLRRAQLFGRSSSDSLPTFQGLKCIEKCRLTGKVTPGPEKASSPLPRLTTASDHGSSQQSSFHGYTDDRGECLSTPDVSSWRSSHRSSRISLRSQLDTVPEDEWIDAGTPEQELIGSGYGPGPTLESKKSLRFSTTKLSHRKTRIATTHAQYDVEKRMTSPAELALRRLTSASSRSPLRHLRKSSWRSRLFERQGPTSSLVHNLTSRLSYGINYELNVVESRNRMESPEDISPHEVGHDAFHDQATTITHDNMMGMGLSYMDEDYGGGIEIASKPDTDKLSSGTPSKDCGRPLSLLISGLERNDVCEDSEYVEVQADAVSVPATDTSSLIPTTVSHHVSASNTSPSLSVTAYDLNYVEHETQPLSRRTTSFACNQAFELATREKQVMECSAPVITLDRSPSPAQAHIALSPTNIIYSVELFVSQAQMSPIQDVVVHAPRRTRFSCGLSFASTNAIIHGCVTFATLRFIMCNLYEDVAVFNLASDLGVAFLTAICVCTALHILSKR
jgi:hypothetical protein